MTLRLIQSSSAEGGRQMALDEALLHAARQPTLRLYRWEPPAVSLGFFQSYPAVRALVPGNVPIVRRITGGGAIWHEHEVTYCLAGVLGRDGFPARTRDLYPLLHGAVLARLSRRGIEVRRQERTEGDRRYEHEPRCFASPAADDIVHHLGGKMLGSAARQRADQVLIHGSLKLASNPWDQDAVTGCGLSWEVAANLMLEAVCDALGIAARPGELSAEEVAAWDRILQERYGSPAWVEERIGPKA